MTTDRSTLESKDRAELTVIAEAMGAKVGSRMRKAQIIDLIVGAEEPQDTDETAEAATEAEGDEANESESSGDGGKWVSDRVAEGALDGAPRWRSRVSRF